MARSAQTSRMPVEHTTRSIFGLRAHKISLDGHPAAPSMA